jgi:outer membrane PBP1 activator LpoA protein
LAPEDEAYQVAERAWLDGYNQALAIIPEGDWGQRVYGAFSENWQQLGGTVLEEQLYPPEQSDFSKQIRSILNLDESDERHKSLQKVLHEKIKFEPRRRQDVDFIFMAAFPRQARLIRPQLKFHYAGNIPIYATSHIYSGKRNKHADRDMDDIIFDDIPWVLHTSKNTPSIQRNINHLWPEESDQFTRFFALGIDAYNLIPYLNLLKTYPYERYNGETGILSLNEHNRIFRQISWARFRNGIPRPL